MKTSTWILISCFSLVAAGMACDQNATQDLKITVLHDAGGLHQVEFTEYYSGENSRLEVQLSSGDIKGHHRAIIQRLAGSEIQVYDLDLDAKEYIAYKTERLGTVDGSARSKVRFSGRTLVINRDSVDTGERRDMFGFQARHIITTQKGVIGPENPNAGNSEVEIDGWYIDNDVSRFPTWVHQAGAGLLPASIAVTPAGRPSGTTDKIEIQQTGPAPRFPLELKTTVVYNLTQPDGSSKRYTRIEENRVMELSRAPVDARLFEVPPDFKKVDKIVDPTLHLEARSHWQRFMDGVRSVFR